MARTFTKNLSNYMSLGVGGLGSLINGAAAVSVHVWARYATLGTTANNNALVTVNINGTGSTGLLLSVHNGTSAVLRAGARSQTADGFQVANGTTVLSSSTYYPLGAVYNFTADTITPYVNGTAEGGASVTFGSNTFTLGTPTTGECIGATFAPPGATAAQWDGQIAEVAIFLGDIGADGFKALAAGYSPKLVAASALVDYVPLLGYASPEPGVRGRLAGTITGTVAASGIHPNIIQPTSPRLFYFPAVISESVGEADGTSDATADGASFAESEAESAGLAVVAGIGASTAEAVGSAAGTSTVAATGESTVAAVGSSAGTSTATAAGEVEGSVGAAAGSSTVDGVGAAIAESVGAAAGASTVAAVGQSTAEAVGSATGTAAAPGVGLAVAAAIGAASGTSSVAAVGAAQVEGVGAAAGTSSVAAIGESIAEAVGAAAGDCIIIGFIEAQIRAVGESEGTSGADALGSGEGAELITSGPWHDPYRTVIRVA